MAVRAVLASRRFKREYPEFVRKYSELNRTFRKFLQFRATHRPDEPFSPNDCRLSKSKLRRAHLVHGRALLIYQLHGSEIRLISLQEHEGIEGGRSVDTRNYARSLNTEDYFLFDVDKAVPEKPDKMTTHDTVDLVADVEAPQTEPKQVETPVETPDTARKLSPPEPEMEPERVSSVTEPVVTEPVEPSQDEIVEYLRDQGLLYLPRPAPRPLVFIKLTKELIAPAGDFLGFDLLASTIHHLTEAEVQARYHRDPAHPTTNLAAAFAVTMAHHQRDQANPDALAVIMARLDEIERRVMENSHWRSAVETPTLQRAASQAPTMPRHAPPPPVLPRTTPRKTPEPAVQAPDDPPPSLGRPRKHEITPQLGRILLALNDLQEKGVMVDSAILKEHIDSRDHASMSAVLWTAQKAGLVNKSPKKGAGFIYRLTAVGQRKTRMLGVWPFTAVSLPVPAYLKNSDSKTVRS